MAAFAAALFSCFIENEQYTVGMITRVIMVERVRPQQTVTPRPFHISEPSPVPNAIGSIPKTVVRVVISIGRRRLRAAVTDAVTTSIPLSRHKMV